MYTLRRRLGFKFKRLGASTKARDDSGSGRTRRSTRGTGDDVSAAAVDTAPPAPITSRSTDRRRAATRGPATSGKRGRTAAAAAAAASSPPRAEVPAAQRGQKRRRRGSHDTYTGAAATDVELPPTSYTGDAALHCLLQNAMAAELAATAACYDGGAKAYVHTACTFPQCGHACSPPCIAVLSRCARSRGPRDACMAAHPVQ